MTTAPQGIFASWQPRYAEHGIPTFPVTIEGIDKKPAVRGYLRIGLAYSGQLALKFPANDCLGFTLGRRTGIADLDIDTTCEKTLVAAFDRFGESPIVVRSLQGRFHAWYRYNGEPRKVRPWPGLPIDLLGGGFTCAPPSQAASGRYEFVQGGLDELPKLRPLRNLELAQAAERHNPERIREPFRGDTLWRHCMRQARHCDDLDALIDVARTYARESMDTIGTTHPFTDAEIERAARQAWKYETTGRNLFGRGGAAILSHAVMDRLARHPDAFALYGMLLRHNNRNADFIMANSMASKFGWGKNRFVAARTCLVDHGVIACVSKGGRGPNDPPIYRWREGV